MIWTDVFQTLVMLAGMLAVFIEVKRNNFQQTAHRVSRKIVNLYQSKTY